MTERPIEIAALLAWFVYSVVLSMVLATDGWELGSFVLFWPAALLLGALVPRWPVVVVPLILSLGLGVLAYEIACPCYEDTVESFCFWWMLGFGLPSAALTAAGVAVRRGLAA